MAEEINTKQTPVVTNEIINYSGDKGPKFGVRHLQILLIGFGMAISFATKTLFSVVIVAMTDNTTTTNADVPTYNWKNKSVIISSILWSGFAVNLIAGYLGKRYGPKWFIVGASLFNSLGFTLIPLCAKIGGSAGVIVCRIVQGLALGCIHPLNSVVTGRWVPPEERSRLGFLGAGITTLVISISVILTGYISQSYLGWPWVFYIFGLVGFIWTAGYAFIGAQSADVHPRISPAEKTYLQTTLFQSTDNEPTPLLKIISSIHVWAIIIGLIGFNWTTVLFGTELPLYLADVMDLDLQTNGTILSIPSIIGLVSGVAFAILSDLIPKRGILSRLNSRRTFHLAGTIGTSLSLICVTYLRVGQITWLIFLIACCNICLAVSGVGGAGTNILDISSKYAGIISGLTEMATQSVSIFAPLMVQWVCADESDAFQWRIVFAASAVFSISTGIFFAVFATADRQNWETESNEDPETEVRK